MASFMGVGGIGDLCVCVWGGIGDVCVCVCVCPDRGGMKEGRSPLTDEVGGLCMASEGQSFLAGL